MAIIYQEPACSKDSFFLLLGMAAGGNASTTYSYQEISLAQYLSPPSWDTYETQPPSISLRTGSNPVVSENGYYYILQGVANWTYAGGVPFTVMFTEPYQSAPLDLTQFIGNSGVSFVNDNGLIGYSASGAFATFDLNTQTSSLFPHPGLPSQQYSVVSLNDERVIAGESFPAPVQGGWAYSNGRFRYFTPPIHGSTSLGQCYCPGRFAGTVGTSNGSVSAWSVHNGIYDVLNGPPGQPLGTASMENHSGVVTGICGNLSAMVWNPGKSLNVLHPLVPGDSSIGIGLDDSNRVWGIEFGSGFDFVVWDTDGTPRNLADYIPPSVIDSWGFPPYFGVNDLTGRIFGFMPNYSYNGSVGPIYVLTPSSS